MFLAENTERIGFINTLIIKAEGTNVSFMGGRLPTSNSKNYDRCMFMFNDDWKSFTKSAVFWQDKDTRYEVLLDSADSCDIPWEVQSTDGFMFVGAVGTSGDITVASKILLVPIREGTPSGNSSSEPTEDIYSQMMTRMSELAQTAENAQTAAEQALASVEEVAQSHPYIGSNGNWYVYDSESGGYADSGVSALSTSGGDMLCSVYDTDGTGVVDNAEALGGLDSSSYATQSDLSLQLSGYATHSYVDEQIALQITAALEGSY